MGRRSLMIEDVARIVAGHQAGRRPSEIARVVGVDRKTVAKYVTAAAADALGADGERLTGRDWENWARHRFPELENRYLRRATWTAISVHDALIAERLAENSSIPAIYRELRKSSAGCPVSLSSFRRYVSERFAA